MEHCLGAEETQSWGVVKGDLTGLLGPEGSGLGGIGREDLVG